MKRKNKEDTKKLKFDSSVESVPLSNCLPDFPEYLRLYVVDSEGQMAMMTSGEC